MRPSAVSTSPEQEFPYGWRFIKRGGELVQVPLTLEDCLHPQEDDHIVTNRQHILDCAYLLSVFRSLAFGPPHTLVSSDLLIDWGKEGMRNHGPDLAVFVGLNAEPEQFAGSLDLKKFDGRCELAIEVVSPSTRDNDVVHKFDHYRKLGIPMYVIIDQIREGGPRSIRAYRLKGDHYVPFEADDEGRVDLPLLGLTIALRDERVVCYDQHFNELGDYTEVSRTLAELEQRHELLEKEMELEIKVRQNAERLLKEADRAREAAENQRRISEDQAAQRIRDLEALVAQLQGAGGPPAQ